VKAARQSGHPSISASREERGWDQYELLHPNQHHQCVLRSRRKGRQSRAETSSAVDMNH